MPEIDGATTPDEETLAFEALVVREVAGAVIEDLDALARAVLNVYEAATIGGAKLAGDAALKLGKAVAARIRAFAWDPMNPRLCEAAMEAHELGVIRTARKIPPGPERRAAFSIFTPTDRPVPNVDRALRKALETAAKIAEGGIRSKGTVAAVAGKVLSGKARAAGSARWVATEGINAGTSDVARKLGLRLIWVAERNACLHCLAHAGWAVEPGDLFPAGLTFDPRPSKMTGVPHPPLHPNCRCQCRTYDGEAGKPDTDRSSLDPAARLAAEARRSVVYQWTDYASAPAQQHAAEVLLKAGAGLPSSVEKRAKAALRKGGVKKPR